MGLEAVFFVGALVLLIALIYGVLNYHYRYRGTERVGDQIVRQRYRENESVPDAKSRADAAPRPSAERLTEPNGREPDFSEDDIQREMFGPRGVKGAPDPAKMTPQRAKKTPTTIDQGHVS
jgi:hypothetical protein